MRGVQAGDQDSYSVAHQTFDDGAMQLRATLVLIGRGLFVSNPWSVFLLIRMFPFSADADSRRQRACDDVAPSNRVNRLESMCRTYCTCSDTMLAMVRRSQIGEYRCRCVRSIFPNAHAAGVGHFSSNAVLSSCPHRCLINDDRPSSARMHHMSRKLQLTGRMRGDLRSLVPAALKIAHPHGDLPPLERDGFRPLPARLAR